MPPLTDYCNNMIRSVHCAGFRWLYTLRDQQDVFYDCCLFTALHGQRLRVFACKHHVLSFTRTRLYEKTAVVWEEMQLLYVWWSHNLTRPSKQQMQSHTHTNTHAWKQVKTVVYIHKCTNTCSICDLALTTAPTYAAICTIMGNED